MVDLPEPIDNPFTLVYDALWDLAEANSNLMQWIATNNRRKYDSWIGIKENISSADLPELALLTDGGNGIYYFTSSESRFLRYYSWAITTGDYNINGIYNQVCWELYRAMSNFCSVLSQLTWDSRIFVTKANLADLREGTLLTDLNRNIKGWASIWRAEVEMTFSTKSLIPSED